MDRFLPRRIHDLDDSFSLGMESARAGAKDSIQYAAVTRGDGSCVGATGHRALESICRSDAVGTMLSASRRDSAVSLVAISSAAWPRRLSDGRSRPSICNLKSAICNAHLSRRTNAVFRQF